MKSAQNSVFLHFFDQYFLEEKGLKSVPPNALREMRTALRLALMLYSRVLVPAASYFENDKCRSLLIEYSDTFIGGKISLIGNGINSDEFRENKLSQYSCREPQWGLYKKIDSVNLFPWHSRQSSATYDIKSRWPEIRKDPELDKLIRRFFSYVSGEFDKKWEEIPEIIENRAVLAQNISPYLFTETRPKMVNLYFQRLLTREYFRSFVIESKSSIFRNMYLLGSEGSFDSGCLEMDIDYGDVVSNLLRMGVLESIMTEKPDDLFRIIDRPEWRAATADMHGFRESLLITTHVERRKRVPNRVSGKRQRLTPTVLIVTALNIEAAAVKAVFGKLELVPVVKGDPHIYVHGSVKTARGGTDISFILATQSDMGKANATTVATHALNSFPSIRDVLMVGIGGGCPNHEKPDIHVRLGDIVVSDAGGVIEYDDIKRTEYEVEIRSTAQKPSYEMIQRINHLTSEEFLGNRPWEERLEEAMSQLGSSRPDEIYDVLNINGIPVPHPIDSIRRIGKPRVFRGRIGSSDTLLKDPNLRDQLRDKFGVRAIEMEGSGVEVATWSHNKKFLLVRGIVDYCDSEKNDKWHMYASAAAAAFARSIVELT